MAGLFESAFTKLINSALKVDINKEINPDVLGEGVSVAPTVEVKTAPVFTIPFKRRRERVFGIFIPFVIGVTIALIPNRGLVSYLFPTEATSGFEIINNLEQSFEIEVPLGMEYFQGDGVSMDVATFVDPISDDPVRRVITLDSETVGPVKTVDEYASQMIKDLKFQFSSNDFSLNHDGGAELNMSPARVIVYEYDREVDSDGGSVSKIRVVNRVLITKENDKIWSLGLTDDINDYEQSAEDFEVTVDSFLTW